jgi:hypothetical protein
MHNIDFGAGESILASHEDEVTRELKSRALRKEARSASSRTNWLSSQFERLHSLLDYWRLTLAKRLAASERADSLPHADEMSFSPGRDSA